MPQSDLFIDTALGRLVSSADNSSPVNQLPPLVRGTTQNFHITLLKPTGGLNPPYTAMPVAGQTIQMAVGVLGAASLLTDQFVWTPSTDIGQPFFAATLPLNTPEIAAAFDAVDAGTILIPATMQVDRIEAGITTNVLLIDVLIKNALILDAVAVSTPGRTLVYAETLRALLLNPSVDSITINSPSRNHARRLALQDDATPLDEIT